MVINTRPVGNGLIFTENKNGLYYKNMSNNEGVYMLSTVE